MEFRSHFDIPEYFRAQRAIERLSGVRRYLWLLALGVPAGLTILSIAIRSLGVGRVAWDGAQLWPWLFFPALAFWGIPRLNRWGARRAFRANPRLAGEIVRIVSSEGVECRDDGTAARFEWRSIERAVETEEFFLLFYAKTCAYFIPQRFVEAGQRTDLRNLLLEQLGERAKLLTDRVDAATISAT